MQHCPHDAGLSQPFVWRLPSQSTQLSAHWPLQTLAVHDGEGMLLVEHAVPQAPQLLVSVARFVGQPAVEMVPKQLAKPELQVYVHSPVPPLQTPSEFGSSGQLPVQADVQVPPTHNPVDPPSLQSPFVQHCLQASPYAPPSVSAHALLGPLAEVQRLGANAGQP